MNAATNYRRRIREEEKKLVPEEVFLSGQYLAMLDSIAAELTGGKLKKVKVYQDDTSSVCGWHDGREIGVNIRNQITGSFLTIGQQSESLIGILGHECGHYNFNDIRLKRKYLDSFPEGIWYPQAPQPGNEQEMKDLDEMNGYFQRKDQEALSLLQQTAAYLVNLMNDVYVEERMCARFPGSIRRGILMNRSRNVEWLPTLRKMVAEGMDKLSILMNLCAQHALSGRINHWDGEESGFLETLQLLVPVLDDAGRAEQDVVRYEAANRILLIAWGYFRDILQKMEQERQQEKKQEDDMQENSKEQGKEETQEQEKEDNPEHSKSSGDEENGAVDAPGRNCAMQVYISQFLKNLPQFIKSSGDDGDGEKPFMAAQDAPEEKTISGEKVVQAVMYQMAKEKVDAQINAEVLQRLQRYLDSQPFDGDHGKVRKQIRRADSFTEQQQNELKECEKIVKKVGRRLKVTLLPVLENQKESTEHRLLMGRRLDMRCISNPNRMIYQKQKHGKKVDTAVGILVDNSGSMLGERMKMACITSLCLYGFCINAGIPICIYGHHTDGYVHENLENEIVYLNCCSEFEPDRNDRLRIAGMSPEGCNRDGAALLYMGQRLLERKEKQKLLILISDGLPNSNFYQGDRAKEDLKDIRRKLMQKGILFQAAAIGEDKEQIREIYQESCLDITDLERLPVILTKQLMKLIRR